MRGSLRHLVACLAAEGPGPTAWAARTRPRRWASVFGGKRGASAGVGADACASVTAETSDKAQLPIVWAVCRPLLAPDALVQ